MSLMLEKPRREIDTKYTKWVKQQPCLLLTPNNANGCDRISTDPHHVKPYGGGKVGSKVSDRRCVPLCRKHHEEVERGRRAFEDGYLIDLENDILRLNLIYPEPKRERKERKVSPTVQHLLIKCRCAAVHRIPARKVVWLSHSVNYYCPSIGYTEAKLRRGA